MNSEFGFDYLRDNGMATSKEQQVQRDYHFAIVDEVDSILIDERARRSSSAARPPSPRTSTTSSSRWSSSSSIKQTMLCNRLVSDAEELFKAGKNEEAARLMVKVKLGQPRNKGFLRMMEDHERRRAIDKMELSFYGDTRKEEFFALRKNSSSLWTSARTRPTSASRAACS